MKFEKICRECGAIFDTHGTCAKYCESCRETAYKKGKNRLSIAIKNDTEAMRKACLSCTSKRCSGTCEELARIARGEA